MTDITATDAARHFSDLLDAVEHEGEVYTIVRRGKAVAHIRPISSENGADVKAFLGRHSPDPDWVEDIKAIRALLEDQARD